MIVSQLLDLGQWQWSTKFQSHSGN